MTKPFKYQRKGVKLIDKFEGRALLADDMGLGKSFQSLLWKKRHGIQRVIVICPASVKWNWEREVSMHLNERAEVLEGRTPPPFTRLTLPPVLIINYEITPQWAEYLSKYKAQLLILDESQRIRNSETQAYKAVRLISLGGPKRQGKRRKRIPYMLCLSGTPIINRPAEFWTTLNLLKPRIFKRKTSYLYRYCQPRRGLRGIEFKGATNTKELNRLVRQHVMIRRRKKDVLKDLPGILQSVVPLPLSIKGRREYDKALADFGGWLREKGKRKLASSRGAMAIIKLGYLKRLAAEMKLPFAEQWIDEFLQSTDEKLLVFGVHRKILDTLWVKYKKLGVLVNGSITGIKRQHAVDKFQTDPKCRIFFGNITAAGVGLNLTAASNVAMVEEPWTPAELNQVIARSNRIGQTKTTNVYHLVAKLTIEYSLCQYLHRKQKVLTDVLDGGQDYDEVSVLESLLEQIEQEAGNVKR